MLFSQMAFADEPTTETTEEGVGIIDGSVGK